MGKIVKIILLFILLVMVSTSFFFHCNLLLELEESIKYGYSIIGFEQKPFMYKIDLLRGSKEYPGIWTLDIAQITLLISLIITLVLLLLDITKKE
ncbi:MAG: hypothetical protein ACTSXJ_04405 [Candidatus Baldrarchaeia archaeon]